MPEPIDPRNDLEMLASQLDWEGVISQEDLEAYLNCCLDALVVHLDRERSRKGLWKSYPAIDQVRQIKLKSERIMSMLDRQLRGIPLTQEEQDKMIEEYPDLINYAIFGWRIEKGDV